ncbi:chemotaxis protein CheD [Alkalibacterium putridalgicola]|uniref:Probable chemoreceptor glutamine deamidase CheD n=1 Tax=Alkalibacterium putridalgicola TaxID=426703 RepID=A0A1H7RCZ7_9LACT|nr:chemotaxis protein CheD [Alkalibacterium putridalgicola]GEK88811.1 putative chemoreceptor glutamine deamidase CheD [Alkalibacterium putridalgicola]SEL58012.1 chemotaxis protein CheD [Alkalibacterium putridalgicola]
MSEQIKVGISDYKLATAPNQLVTIGLGSCVGIALYAPESKIGALSHIMLPDSSSFSDTSKWAKFANLALPNIVNELREQTKETKILAKIAGGASMFTFTNESQTLQIGLRNIEAVKATLTELEIPIVSEHVGGKMGRSMYVDLNDFNVKVRMVNREEFIL